MNGRRFDRVIDTPEALRAIIPPPADLVIRKQLPALDGHAKDFLARSPFVVLGTCGRTRGADVSPRGEAPGGFVILDDRTIAIGDRPGNRRNDSFLNLLENPQLALLFLVPGVEETLRVNGRGTVVVDAELFGRLSVGGKPPLVALVVEIEEVFFQCAKALLRSKLWKPESWPDPARQKPLAEILKEQVPSCEMSLEQLDRLIQEGNRDRLY
jgi:hypothetical protein